ncbi:MAG: DNA/RNA non-specific endonuclease [Chloroflexi bacterium]|nr:DNA/RNA non-specific endonuclease [Chloroflexota bacterium]
MTAMRKSSFGIAVLTTLLSVASTGWAGGRPVQEPPDGYQHDRYAPVADILREFRGFTVSFDSKDDDDGIPGGDLLRVPHWVAQELRRWEPPEEARDDPSAWCLETLRNRPTWFTDDDLFATGVAPNDASYRSSGFDRGHMAMKLLVERLGQDAAYNTHTVLNAIPQRPKFNQGIWQHLEYLTGAWVQKYEQIWVIQGPVFYQKRALAWIGDDGERRVAVPDAAFKLVVREKTELERNKAGPQDQDALEVLAFLYPQLGPGYFGPRQDYRHARFLTSVDEIEELTGLDFPLSDDPVAEKRLERHRADTLWEPETVDLKQRELFLSGCRG